MKRKLFLLTGIIFVLLSGCGKEKNSAVKDQFESGYIEKECFRIVKDMKTGWKLGNTPAE